LAKPRLDGGEHLDGAASSTRGFSAAIQVLRTGQDESADDGMDAR